MTQEVVLGSKKFAALHKAMVKSGVFLYVPRGVEVELPLESSTGSTARTLRPSRTRCSSRRK